MSWAARSSLFRDERKRERKRDQPRGRRVVEQESDSPTARWINYDENYARAEIADNLDAGPPLVIRSSLTWRALRSMRV